MGPERALLEWLNGFAGHWPALDAALVMLAFNDLLKGGITAACCWWLWFGGREPRARRATVLATLAGVIAALAFNRWLATVLPFRERPLKDPDLHFVPPAGVSTHTFSDLSAFPSDHAVMFVGIATGLLVASRPAGLLLLLHALLLVLPVRLYAGLHWPSDMLAGAALGASFALLANLPPVKRLLARPLLAWARRHPASFHALFFLFLLELATLFQGSVRIGYLLLRLSGHEGRL